MRNLGRPRRGRRAVSRLACLVGLKHKHLWKYDGHVTEILWKYDGNLVSYGHLLSFPPNFFCISGAPLPPPLFQAQARPIQPWINFHAAQRGVSTGAPSSQQSVRRSPFFLVSINGCTPIAGWFIVEKPSFFMNDLGVPLFQETSIYIHLPTRTGRSWMISEICINMPFI